MSSALSAVQRLAVQATPSAESSPLTIKKAFYREEEVRGQIKRVWYDLRIEAADAQGNSVDLENREKLFSQEFRDGCKRCLENALLYGQHFNKYHSKSLQDWEVSIDKDNTVQFVDTAHVNLPSLTVKSEAREEITQTMALLRASVEFAAKRQLDTAPAEKWTTSSAFPKRKTESETASPEKLSEGAPTKKGDEVEEVDIKNLDLETGETEETSKTVIVHSPDKRKPVESEASREVAPRSSRLWKVAKVAGAVIAIGGICYYSGYIPEGLAGALGNAAWETITKAPQLFSLVL